MLISLSVLDVIIRLVFVSVAIELLPADLDWKEELHLDIKRLSVTPQN